MKNRIIGAAVASALATSAAYALPPTSAAQFTVYAGGGSAQAQAVLWAVNQIVNTNVDAYTDGACGAQSGNYRVVFGQNSAAITFAGGTTVPANSNILVYYRLAGGSFPNGAQPQGLGSNLTYPAITGATPCSGAAFPLPTFAIPGSAATVNAVPDWGLTDEEVPLFNVVNNVPGASPANVLSPVQLSNISQVGIYNNLFGIAVTNNLFAQKSNFSKAEVEAILAGTFTDWSQLFGDNGAALPAGPIVLLDRAAGSGSKAAGNQYFLSYPSAIGTGGAQTPGNINFGPSGSLCNGDYADINEGSSGNIVRDLVIAANASNCRAIAVLGLEFPPALQNPSAVGKYSFVKIQGSFPDAAGGINGSTSTGYENVINGNYDFFFQNSFNFRTKRVGGNAQHWVGDGTGFSSLISRFQQAFQSSSLPGCSTGSTALNPAGTLLDPVVVTTNTNGRTRGSRATNSTAPLQLIVDASQANAACVDTL